MGLNKAEKVNIKEQYACPDNCITKQSDPEACKSCKAWIKAQKTSYRHLTRFFRTELTKAARRFQPYDYGFLVSFLHIALSYMEAYYDLGYNVFSSEEDRLRIDRSLNEVLDLLEAGFDDDLSEQCTETLTQYLKRHASDEADYQMLAESTASFVDRTENIKKLHEVAIKKAFKKMGEDVTTWID